MKTMNSLIRCALVALCSAPVLLAQSKQVIVNASVPEVLNLTVDVSAVSLAFVAADYDNITGLAVKLAPKATTFSVETNRDWRLSVRPSDAVFTYRPMGTQTDPKKPVSDLSIRTGTSAYMPFLGIAELTVASGKSGGTGKEGNIIPVDYQLKSSSATDTPGQYLLSLTYTLVAK
jgi:hypothetical protein